ncbi:MAG TPA: acetoacetate decarboxylase family protein [Methanoregulaceae archaeon]|nr:acetoacetate decarboxylase family protein [Methanoregulaceae archaeon]
MFRFDETKTYRMPPHFGGNDPAPPGMAVYNRDTTGLTFTCTTEADRLERFIPDCFELLRPDIVFGFGQLREIDWLAGGHYNVVTADVPVRFVGERDRIEGNYNLVTWENRATPILGGREENGVPKVYAEIEDLHAWPAAYLGGPDYFTNASYDGNTFVRMEMRDPRPVKGEEFAALRASMASVNLFGWRYIPNVSGPGAALSQPILYPQGFELGAAWKGTGAIEWIRLAPWQNPTQFHIINALADLPILGMGPVMLTKGTAVLKPSQGRVLE